MLAKTAKIYDFPMERVKDQAVDFLKKRGRETTVADLVAGTGLPKYQAEQALKVVLDEYRGSLKATESGELLYCFPRGLHSSARGFGPSLRRFWKVFSPIAARVLSFLFKIWIVAMLIGYFILFLAVLVLSVVVAFAGGLAARGENRERSERSDSGFGGMALAMRILDFGFRMWFWSSLLGPEKKKKTGKPLYLSVFSFVFGEPDANKALEEMRRKRILAHLRGHKGVLTEEELMTITGATQEDASALMNRLLLEYEGEPQVTEGGTVIFFFPEILRTKDAAPRALEPTADPVVARTRPFSSNKPRTNAGIAFFNAFNLAFGSYFTCLSLMSIGAIDSMQGFLKVPYAVVYNLLNRVAPDPRAVEFAVFGAVPLLFSLLFYLIPLIRGIRLSRENDRIRTENLRRAVYGAVRGNPGRVAASAIWPQGPEGTPKKAEQAVRRILDAYAAGKRAEPVQEKDDTAYAFPELIREMEDVEKHRRTVDPSKYAVGKTVFDSEA